MPLKTYKIEENALTLDTVDIAANLLGSNPSECTSGNIKRTGTTSEFQMQISKRMIYPWEPIRKAYWYHVLLHK